MRIKTMIIIISSVLIFSSGCGVNGTWQAKSFEPEVARQEFNFLGASVLGRDFTDAKIKLNENKTYSANIFFGDEVVMRNGNWKKTEDKITFIDNSGEAYSYRYEKSGDELLLKEIVQGTQVELILEKTD